MRDLQRQRRDGRAYSSSWTPLAATRVCSRSASVRVSSTADIACSRRAPMLWDFALRGRRLAAFGAALRAGFFAAARFTVLRLAVFLAFFLTDLTLPLRAFATLR